MEIARIELNCPHCGHENVIFTKRACRRRVICNECRKIYYLAKKQAPRIAYGVKPMLFLRVFKKKPEPVNYKTIVLNSWKATDKGKTVKEILADRGLSPA